MLQDGDWWSSGSKQHLGPRSDHDPSIHYYFASSYCSSAVARREAELHTLLGAGGVFGDIGERLAAVATDSSRISGTGNDLRRSAPDGWRRPLPMGVHEDSTGAQVAQIKPMLGFSGLERYERWLSDSDQHGEVKTRQLDSRWATTNCLILAAAGG